jgi:hypothetical protein
MMSHVQRYMVSPGAAKGPYFRLEVVAEWPHDPMQQEAKETDQNINMSYL